MTGDLELSAGARNVVTVDSAGNHSQLVVGGAATIGGATIAVILQEGSYGRVTFYPVLYAEGGVTGTATTVTTNSTLESWVTLDSQCGRSDVGQYGAATRIRRDDCKWSCSWRCAGSSSWCGEWRSGNRSRANFWCSKMRPWIVPSVRSLVRFMRRRGNSPHLDGEAMMDLVREQMDWRADSRSRCR